MVELVYNYGDVNGHTEMCCYLEDEGTLTTSLRQCGAKVYGRRTENEVSRILEIPDCHVLDVIQMLEREIANSKTPFINTLPMGDDVFECEEYYMHLEVLARHILLIDILYKWHEVSE